MLDSSPITAVIASNILSSSWIDGLWRFGKPDTSIFRSEEQRWLYQVLPKIWCLCTKLHGFTPSRHSIFHYGRRAEIKLRNGVQPTYFAFACVKILYILLAFMLIPLRRNARMRWCFCQPKVRKHHFVLADYLKKEQYFAFIFFVKIVRNKTLWIRNM
jgi:hypothetical protein